MRIAIGKRGRKPIIPELEICEIEEHLCPVCKCYVPESTFVCPSCGERFLKPDEREPMRVTPKELAEMIQRRKRFVGKDQWKIKLEIQKLEQAQIDCQNTKAPEPDPTPTAPEISPKPVYSEPEAKGERMDERTWRWLGALLLSLLCFILIYSTTVPHRNTTTPVAIATPTSIPAIEDLEILDYVEVYKHRQDYEGQTISIAGRISDISEDSIYFRERFFSDIDRSGFEIDIRNCLSQNETAYQRFECGQYVNIKGTVNNSSFSYGPELEGTDILCVGEDAKSHVDPLMETWYLQGQTYAKTLPLTDYMDIVNNPDTFNGQRVRIAGKMQCVGANLIGPYFSFRNLENNFKVLSMDLRSCPVEMTAACEEDVYVVVSGVVNDGSFLLELIDCYIECVGEEAEAIAMQSEADWWQRWQERRNAYISECEEYSYDQLARYPEQYNGSQITVSGRVVKIDVGLGSDNVLLDVGDGNQMYVCYSGKQYRDPEILKNDQITFYGTYSGKQNYAFSDTEEERLPYLIARYSSINS